MPKISAAKQLHTAIHLRNLAGVKECLSYDPECLEERDEYGNTPLHSAAYMGQRDAVDTLIEAGWQIKKQAHHPQDFSAAFSGFLNAQNASLNTPLHTAVFVMNVGAVRALAEAGADLDAKNASSCTPIDWAFKQMAGNEKKQHKVDALGSIITILLESQRKRDGVYLENMPHVACLLQQTGSTIAVIPRH